MARKGSRGKKLKEASKKGKQQFCKLANMGKEDEEDAKIFYNELKGIARRFYPRQVDVIDKIQSEEQKHHQALKAISRRVCR